MYVELAAIPVLGAPGVVNCTSGLEGVSVNTPPCTASQEKDVDEHYARTRDNCVGCPYKRGN